MGTTRDDEKAAAKLARKEKRSETADRNRLAFEEFLLRQSPAALTEKLLALAGQSREAVRDLNFWMKSESGDAGKLKSLVFEGLRAPAFIRRVGCRAYAGQVARVLALLRMRMAKGDYLACAGAAQAALKKLFKVAENCEDSDGVVGDRIREMRDLHVEALGQLDLNRKALGRTVFELRFKDPWGIVELMHYEATLGYEGLAEYGAILEKTWAAPPKETALSDPYYVDIETAKRMRLDSMMVRWRESKGELAGLINAV